MDDPDIAWPAWKFGMRRDALFTTLHDQYNTFQSTIQDPDAFHHDVFEIANEAATTSEFHDLLATRRDQRLRELNESLESASFEIIANPELVGTTQWEYALQLFRTRSLDSLVRYFASYLPANHRWHSSCDAKDDNDEVHEQSEQNEQTTTTVATSPKPFFDDGVLTQEPMAMPLSHSLSHTSLCHDLPPSPRSLTTYSDDMYDEEALQAHKRYCLDTLTPARTLSVANSDAGDIEIEGEHSHSLASKLEESVAADAAEEIYPSQCDDDTSQSYGPDTPVSMSDAEPDIAEAEPIQPSHSQHNTAVIANTATYAAELEQFTAASTPKKQTSSPNPLLNPIDDTDVIVNNKIDNNTTAAAATATPTRSSPRRHRPLQLGYAVDDAIRSCSPLPVHVRVRHRSVSPSRPWPLVHAESGQHHHHPAAPAGIIANHDYSRRAGDCPPRRGRRHLNHHTRLEIATPTSSSSITRSVSSNGLGRRRPGCAIEKTVLPRPMRTRQRERREAAAASAAVDNRPSKQ
ncbi:MAG: hypothetical protein STHCBS139747_008063 [Sporothrix thermara]